MFARDNEERFPAISAHKKPTNLDWDIAVAEYLEETGATDLDSPDAPRRKTPRSDIHLVKLSGIEHQIARSKAKQENAEALARLADGTAVLRQKRERPIAIKKAAKKAPKTVALKTPKSRKVRAPKIKPVSLKKTSVQLRQSVVKNRLKSYIKTLKAGESIKMIASMKGKRSNAEYSLQRKDMSRLSEMLSEDIIRVKNIKSDESVFLLDRYKRYETEGLIDIHEPKALLRALMSDKMVCADDVKQKPEYVYKHVARLARKYGFDIFVVYSTRYTLGWILIEQTMAPKELARLQEISKLADALDALKYLAMKQKLQANRFPMTVPDVILDAAFREFKRVEKCGQ